jgi:zinc and cadmium transporter
MVHLQVYTLLSVLLVSVISLVGIFFLAFREKLFSTILLELVSFSVGALLGDVFIHMFPEISANPGFTVGVSLAILGGFLFSFVVEKFIHWQHCHDADCHEHMRKRLRKGDIKPYAILNLIGEAVHNFIDGVVIAAAYLTSVHVGLATTLAVLLHEIPHEVGNFAILVHGGFGKWRAVMLNVLTAITAFLGALLTLFVSARVEQVTPFLLPFAAGTFLYIAGTDIIPELHKETRTWRNVAQLAAILAGVGVMGLMLYFG